MLQHDKNNRHGKNKWQIKECETFAIIVIPLVINDHSIDVQLDPLVRCMLPLFFPLPFVHIRSDMPSMAIRTYSHLLSRQFTN